MDMKKQHEIQQKWLEIISKAIKNEDFKRKLLENPNLVLREEGLELPENIQAKIFEEDNNTRYLILPEKPLS